MSFYYFLVFALLVHCANVSYAKEISSQTSHSKCEPIVVDFCKNLPYNETVMPNLMNQDNQETAGLEIHQFWPLVELKCSSNLKLFLCAMYVPKCSALGKPLPPCRPLCESARVRCEGLMEQFGFSWPELMVCSKFPERGNGSCFGEETEETKAPEVVRANSQQSLKSKPQRKRSPYQYSEQMSSTTTTTHAPYCNTKPTIAETEA